MKGKITRFILAFGLATLAVTVQAQPTAHYLTPQNRVAAVGPEISIAFPKEMFFVSARYLYEFIAENRAQGQTFTLSFTKRF